MQELREKHAQLVAEKKREAESAVCNFVSLWDILLPYFLLNTYGAQTLGFNCEIFAFCQHFYTIACCVVFVWNTA